MAKQRNKPTVSEAARRLGVHPSTICRYRSGKRKVREWNQAVRLARIVRCKPEDLMRNAPKVLKRALEKSNG